MEFFGITQYGPQNYIKDMLKDGYKEPVTNDDVGPLMQKVKETSTCPSKIGRPDVNVIRIIDVLGRVNGFAYGSFQRFYRMKRKGVIKPVGPTDMFRLPPSTSTEFGWWICDPELADKNWYQPQKRYPQPRSPNTRILDIVKMNNKYASLF